MNNDDVGSGGRTGGIKTVIHVNDQADEITLLYMEQIPWYFRLFLHTLKITNLDDPRIEIQPGNIFRISFVPSTLDFSSNLLSTGP